MSLVEIKNLNIYFKTHDKEVHAVRGFDLSMGKEKVAIVGESGAGKSQSAMALLGLSKGRVVADKLEFDGQNLLTLPRKTFKEMRSKRMAMIMQDPKYSLNPILKVGNQLSEVLPGLSKKERKEKIVDALHRVNIRHPEKVFHSYPFELSGGMGQRVVIAQVLLTNPDLLIADEPTSSIDATAKRSVLEEMDRLIDENDMGLIFISHDLPLVASYCDRVIVMYQGQVMETLDAKNLKAAKHPYTQALLQCLPEGRLKGNALQTVDRNLIGI